MRRVHAAREGELPGQPRSRSESSVDVVGSVERLERRAGDRSELGVAQLRARQRLFPGALRALDAARRRGTLVVLAGSCASFALGRGSRQGPEDIRQQGPGDDRRARYRPARACSARSRQPRPLPQGLDQPLHQGVAHLGRRACRGAAARRSLRSSQARWSATASSTRSTNLAPPGAARHHRRAPVAAGQEAHVDGLLQVALRGARRRAGRPCSRPARRRPRAARPSWPGCRRPLRGTARPAPCPQRVHRRRTRPGRRRRSRSGAASKPKASITSQASTAARASPPWLRARGHRADEDARVERALLHADAVAEQRAAGERARGIHGQDADGALAPAR